MAHNPRGDTANKNASLQTNNLLSHVFKHIISYIVKSLDYFPNKSIQTPRQILMLQPQERKSKNIHVKIKNKTHEICVKWVVKIMG